MNSLDTTPLMENWKAGSYSLRALAMESILKYRFAKFIWKSKKSFLAYNVKNVLQERLSIEAEQYVSKCLLIDVQ